MKKIKCSQEYISIKKAVLLLELENTGNSFLNHKNKKI